MLRSHRLLAAVLATLIVATSCSSDGTTSPSGEPTPGGMRTITESPDDLARAIADSGFGVVASVGDPLSEHLVTVTEHQLAVMADEVAAQSGLRGSDLDAAAPMPPDMPALSFWIAAWLHDAPTPRAQLAADWYEPETDWTQAPQLLYPRAVILMFVADIAEDMDRTSPPLDPDSQFLIQAASPVASPTQTVLAAGEFISIGDDAAGGGVVGAACEAISTFFGNQIAALFNALRLSDHWLGSGGVFGFIGGLVADLWNTVIGIASDVTVGLVRNLTRPVVEALATAVAVAGVVSQIGTYIQGWNIDVDADPGMIAFAVGSAPDNVGKFEVTPHSAYRPWQPDLESCARSLGVTLPKLLEPGSPVEWTIKESSPGLIEVTSRDDVIREGAMPVLRYRAGREDSDDGEFHLNRVDVSARIPRAELHNVLALVRNRLNATIDWIVSSTLRVPALADVVAAEIHRLLGPVLKDLDAAVTGQLAGTPLVVQGTTNLIVINHTPTTTTTSTTSTTIPEEPLARTCPLATIAEVEELTGVGGLSLAHVYLPGDTIEGQFVPFTNCAWGNADWSIHYALYRTPNAPQLYAGQYQEMFGEPDPIMTPMSVPGPWDEGFSWAFADGRGGGFQMWVVSSEMLLEVFLWGEPFASAQPFAEFLWERAGG